LIKDGQVFYDTIYFRDGSVSQVPEKTTAGGNDSWDAMDSSDYR
jgi:hypothetical protein